jgi:hypothetical protein
VSSHDHVPALRCAIDSFGADRLLLGTDFPYENGDIFLRAVNHVNDPEIGPNATDFSFGGHKSPPPACLTMADGWTGRLRPDVPGATTFVPRQPDGWYQLTVADRADASSR